MILSFSNFLTIGFSYSLKTFWKDLCNGLTFSFNQFFQSMFSFDFIFSMTASITFLGSRYPKFVTNLFETRLRSIAWTPSIDNGITSFIGTFAFKSLISSLVSSEIGLLGSLSNLTTHLLRSWGSPYIPTTRRWPSFSFTVMPIISIKTNLNLIFLLIINNSLSHYYHAWGTENKNSWL